jgi:type VI secretion system protein ImpA
MSSPAVFDLDALLAPIPGDSPTGVDLREDENSPFYDLRSLRLQCGAEERQIDSGDPDAPARAPWEKLAEDCENVLRDKSKDLQIACWLVEAQARIRRDPPVSEFAALRDGFKLVTGLCAQYWDTLFSNPGDEPGDKGQPLLSLNEGALVPPIRKIPLTLREDPGPFSYWQIDVQQKKGDMGAIDTLVRKGGRDFYMPLLTDLAEARAALAALETTIAERMNSSAANIREAFEQVQAMVQHISGYKLGEAATAAAGAPGVEGKAPAAAGGGRVRVDGEFGSRDEALEALLQIARFFREREPQATISYTIEDAVRRARLPLADLLLELMDEDTRRKMLLNAGIMPPKASE